MLKIQQLRVSYGGIQALRGIDLEVPDGKIVTLIGANGAGKSTTLRTISGLVKAESGSIQWNGEELLGKPIDKIISAGIAMSPEGRRVFADLTVLENLKLGAYLRKDKAEIEKDLKWVYQLFPRLEERNWQSAGTLSGGEQQMLAVGRALMSRPKLMMLDEPSLGLAPLVVQDIFSIIREINRQGVTVLLIEQNANMALKIADLAYVLETGNITMSGTGAELLRCSLYEFTAGRHSGGLRPGLHPHHQFHTSGEGKDKVHPIGGGQAGILFVQLVDLLVEGQAVVGLRGVADQVHRVEHAAPAVAVKLHEDLIAQVPDLAAVELLRMGVAKEIGHEMTQDAQLLAVLPDRHLLPVAGQILRLGHDQVVDILFEMAQPQQARRNVRQHIPSHKRLFVQLRVHIPGEIPVEVPAHGDVGK